MRAEQARQGGSRAGEAHGHVVFGDADDLRHLRVAQAFEREHHHLAQSDRQGRHRGLQALVPLLQRQRVFERELSDAQAYLAGSFPLTIETPNDIATSVINAVFYELPIEEVATPGGFARNPELVQRFYNLRRQGVLEALPNAAHRALVDLEARLGERFTIITQNIDDLHGRAGSKRLLHMHGEILKARCTRCGRVLAWTKDIASSDRCPGCSSGLRPHVVWFGEMPLYMDDEIPAALAAEVFVSIGTSGVSAR